jgi:hypothetical protein
MIANKMSNLTKSPKFYLLLCWAMVFSFFLETRVANSATFPGIAVEAFTQIQFGNSPQCWQVQIGANSTSIQYTNTCGLNTVVLTLLNGTTQTFIITPAGKLVFFGGNGNVVHIINGEP